MNASDIDAFDERRNGMLRKTTISPRDQIIAALKLRKANGLCRPDQQCGCGIEDLSPADCIDLDLCVAAKSITPERGDPRFWDEFPEGYYAPIKHEPATELPAGLVSCGHMRISPDAAKLGKKAVICACPGAEGLCEINWQSGGCPCEDEIII